MKKPLLCLFEGVQWLKWGISVDESLLFGVRVRRVFVVLRLLHGGCNHEEQPGTVQKDDLKQGKDHQNNKNRSNHSVPPENGQTKTTVRVHRGLGDDFGCQIQNFIVQGF